MNSKLNKETRYINLGLIDYQKGWHYQERLFLETINVKMKNRQLDDEQQELTPNYLIFCYHPHVYTLGRSGNQDNLLLSGAGLKAKGAQFYKTNRGGDITYHGPGQLVGYPILDLDNFFTDIHKYLRYLEEAVILTLSDYHLESGRIDGLTGVWIDHQLPERARKICALGVKTSRWVTMHGFAFNVLTDLSYFKHIIPCGIDHKAITSLEKELGYRPDMPEVEERLKGHLADLFDMKWVDR